MLSIHLSGKTLLMNVSLSKVQTLNHIIASQKIGRDARLLEMVEEHVMK